MSQSYTFPPNMPQDEVNKCPHCKECFSSQKLFERHLSAVHGDQLPFNCTECGKGFFTLSGLKRHQNDHYADRFSCQFCDIQVKRKQYLIKHLKNVHKLFTCVSCVATFRTQQELYEHLATCRR